MVHENSLGKNFQLYLLLYLRRISAKEKHRPKLYKIIYIKFKVSVNNLFIRLKN